MNINNKKQSTNRNNDDSPGLNTNVREPTGIEQTVGIVRDSFVKSSGQEMNEHRKMYEKEGQRIADKSYEGKAILPTAQTDNKTINLTNTLQNETHENNNKEHLTRLRKAMKVIEEEIKHIELMSEKVS